MEDTDPITQFFPGQEDVDLYQVLNLTNDATIDAIKKSYRRLALIYHPDKHATSSEEAKIDASTNFQRIGFAYAVLSDGKRKTRYDKTGKTDEGFELAAGEDGWETYFEDLFERVTRGKLDELKKEYQGSTEEVEDLKSAYLETDGSIGEIMTYIPHSTHEDEGRFVMIITSLISKGDLKPTKLWEKSVKDEKAEFARKKEGEKEAKEAEELAKELGVWEEFYGSGKATDRSKKGKGKAAESTAGEGDEDYFALQALILKKRKKNMDDLVDNLAAKYAPKPKGKGKKRARNEDKEEVPSSKKKSRNDAPPEISDEEFAKLQDKLFGDKAKKSAGGEEPKPKKGKAKGTK